MANAYPDQDPTPPTRRTLRSGRPLIDSDDEGPPASSTRGPRRVVPKPVPAGTSTDAPFNFTAPPAPKKAKAVSDAATASTSTGGSSQPPKADSPEIEGLQLRDDFTELENEADREFAIFLNDKVCYIFEKFA